MISLSLLTCCLAPLAWHCRAAGRDEIVVPEELVHRGNRRHCNVLLSTDWGLVTFRQWKLNKRDEESGRGSRAWKQDTRVCTIPYSMQHTWAWLWHDMTCDCQTMKKWAKRCGDRQWGKSRWRTASDNMLETSNKTCFTTCFDTSNFKVSSAVLLHALTLSPASLCACNCTNKQCALQYATNKLWQFPSTHPHYGSTAWKTLMSRCMIPRQAHLTTVGQ